MTLPRSDSDRDSKTITPRLVRALVSIVAAATLVACGSSSSSPSEPAAPDDTGSSGGSALDSGGGGAKTDTGAASMDTGSAVDTASGSDVASPPDTATAIDSSPAPDTGTPADETGAACDKPSGGDPCDPGVVVCGGAPCNTATQFCCAKDSTTGSCLANGASCADNSIHCDERSDCPSGQVCCLVANSVSSADATCQTSCSGGLFNVQLCRTDSECPSGACQVQTCSGSKVEACDSIPGC